MRWWNSLLTRLPWRSRHRREADLARELRDHLELEAEAQLESGLPPGQARYAARRAFGNATLVKEQTRETWGWAFWSNLLKDLHYGLRLLRRNPLFTAVAAISLALGIGANTAIFSLINVLLLKALPVQDPRTLIVLATQGANGGGTNHNFYFETYQRLRTEQPFFSQLAAYSPARMNVSVDGDMEPSVQGQLVSGNYFSVLGVGAAVGRMFTREDNQAPGAHPVAVLSYQYWGRRFARSGSVVGKTLRINGTPFTIVGVTPPGFSGFEVGISPDITVPLMMQPQVMPDKENWVAGRPTNIVDWLRVFGRLQPGVTSGQALAGMRLIYRRIQTQLAVEMNPEWERMWLKEWSESPLLLEPGGTGLSDLRRQFSQPLFILMAVAGLVLIIACVNIANLLLARASARQREIAVRLAIGAGRLRLLRQLLVESMLLSLLGGALGVLLAYWGNALLVRFLSTGRTPITLDLNPDLRVLVFTAAACVVTGLLFGLAPALRASRLDLTPALNEAGRAASSRQRLGRTLAVSQVALSLVLVIGAGLLGRSLRNLNSVDQGFQRDRVLTVCVEPRGSDSKRGPNALRLHRLYLDLQQRIQDIPGVIAASLAGGSPTATPGQATVLTSDGQRFRVSWRMVYPNYFETLSVPILQGRDFISRDMADAAPPALVVSQNFARRAFPGQNPVGQHVICAGRRNCEIVGVVPDVRYSNLRGEAGDVIYQTFLHGPTGRGQMVLHVRVARQADHIIPALRREVGAVDPNLPAFEIQTLASEIDAVLVRERLLSLLSTLFGGLAAVLAAVGLYGVMAYAVARRTKEIGIRMALGAAPHNLRRQVLGETLGLAALGIILGLPLAFGATRFIASQLFGLRATDPIVLLSATLFMVLTALIAGYLPARRASRIDPLVALRAE